jgi:quercetin dioxygenase-like cupin family protein
MTFTRRDLAALLPSLVAVDAAAQTPSGTPLASKVYHSDQMPYSGDDKKKGREFFHAPEHSGFNLEAHETILGPETQTHAPHKHEHEEIIFVFAGTAETFLEGKTEIAETGSVIFFGSNQMHSIRNAGTAPCRYYVLELRGKEA